jgi:hypothetical protein
MTKRLKGCTVVFDGDFREDDAEALLAAIRMIKGVVRVEPTESAFNDFEVRTRVVLELHKKLQAVLKDAWDGR